MSRPDLVFLIDGKNEKVEHLIPDMVLKEIQAKRAEEEAAIERMKQDVISKSEPVTTH